jgi:hypothetical protein
MKSRYPPVCVGSLYSLMVSVVSFLMSRTSTEGFVLSDSISIVNLVEVLNYWSDWGNSVTARTHKARPQICYQHVGAKAILFVLCLLKGKFLKIFHVDIANDGRQRDSHCHVLFQLEQFSIHLKIYGSQTNFQQFPDGFDLQDWRFRNVNRCGAYVDDF